MDKKTLDEIVKKQQSKGMKVITPKDVNAFQKVRCYLCGKEMEITNARTTRDGKNFVCPGGH